MPYVMPRDGFTIRDPERRDKLPAGRFRRVPEGGYWRRLARNQDVVLREDDSAPDIKSMEGYEAPVEDDPGDKPAAKRSAA